VQCVPHIHIVTNVASNSCVGRKVVINDFMRLLQDVVRQCVLLLHYRFILISWPCPYLLGSSCVPFLVSYFPFWFLNNNILMRVLIHSESFPNFCRVHVTYIFYYSSTIFIFIFSLPYRSFFPFMSFLYFYLSSIQFIHIYLRRL
jgi:hypothetical protein